MDGIVTPEAVVLDVETAGVASRVFAGIIDFAIQLGILWVGAMLLAASGVVDSSSSNMGTALLIAAVVMGYPVLSETFMRGRTIGKRALGLRAVTLEGAPIRLRHASLRMMGGLVDRFLPPLGVTGMLMVMGTARHQRVGDLLAGTIVIRDPTRTLLPPAVWFPVPMGLEAFAATIDPTALTDQQYTVIRTFLIRNRELSVDARYSLAADLAARAAATLHHDGLRRVHPEAYLLCVISRYQRRNFPTHQPAAWHAGQPQFRTPS
ncbi:MAG TPA: RDD family protein [Ilumatobacteraceae bacterium]|nr:RDD family protein [Ilumatobacteraceae bacterium]